MIHVHGHVLEQIDAADIDALGRHGHGVVVNVLEEGRARGQVPHLVAGGPLGVVEEACRPATAGGAAGAAGFGQRAAVVEPCRGGRRGRAEHGCRTCRVGEAAGCHVPRRG